MPKDVPLAVELPVPDKDKPAWVKVGVIAAVGFVIGIAWPRVMGVRLGPAAPHESAAAAAAAAASGSAAGRAPEAPPASVVAKSPPVAGSAASSSAAALSAAASGSAAPVSSPAAAAPPTITVQKSTVLSCKTEGGETKKGKECGAVPGIDQIVTPRVKKIATCSGVEGQTGKLSLVVNADFSSGRFWYDVGKSSTVTNVDAVAACLKTSFHGTSTTATPHEHPRYTVAYTALLAANDADKGEKHKAKEAPADDKSVDDKKADEKKVDEKKAEPSAAAGEASVAWEVALVRDNPKTGEIVSRLPRGSKVKVGAAKDGWFQIKFGDDFGKEGWVYRGAIGR